MTNDGASSTIVVDGDGDDGRRRSNSKKRLSRKEQKARKKQKRDQDQQQQAHVVVKPGIVGDETKEISKVKVKETIIKGKKKKKKKRKKDDKTVVVKEENEEEEEEEVEEEVEENEEESEIYIPTPIPSFQQLEHKHNNDNDKDSKKKQNKALGKWFPKAMVRKSCVQYDNTIATNKNNKNETKRGNGGCASLLLFYQYTNPRWTQSQVDWFIAYLLQIAESRPNIGGRFRVAQEGVNATISAGDYYYYKKEDDDDDDDDKDNDDDDTNIQTQNKQKRYFVSAKSTLRHVAKDLQRFHTIFQETDFKYIDDLSGDRHFSELKIFPVHEIVYYGIDDSNGGHIPTNGGIHLPPKEFHNMLSQSSNDTVVIDVRNHYEAVLGRFDGQQVQQLQQPSSSTTSQPSSEATATTTTKGKESSSSTNEEKEDGGSGSSGVEGSNSTPTTGAVYIDPKMRKSTDFTKWLAQDSTKATLQNKNVLLYCTGGVRCERASAYINSTMSNQVKGVYQLKGGIEKYLQQFPDGGYWRGKNFVFDKREAFGVDNLNGDGGVVRGKKVKQQKEQQQQQQKMESSSGLATNTDHDNAMTTTGTATTITPAIQTKCCLCNKTWDRYVGKKKCSTCGVPVVMCDTCMSTKPKEEQLRTARCPLCIEEHVTVRVEDVEWTNNGVDNKKKTTAKQIKKKNKNKKSDGSDEIKTTMTDVADNDDGDTANATTTNTQESHSQSKEEVEKVPSPPKVAPSVLKWGGGHATHKKEKRRWSRTPCRFGTDCIRKDCFFAHPNKKKIPSASASASSSPQKNSKTYGRKPQT